MTANRTEAPRKEKRAGLRLTLFFYLAVFCLVVLLLIWIVQGFLINHIYYNLAVRRMDRAATELAAVALSPEDHERVESIAIANQATVAVFFREGAGLGARYLQASGDIGNVLFRMDSKTLSALCADAAAAGGGIEHTFRAHTPGMLPSSPEEENTGGARRLIVVRLLTNGEGREIAVFFDTHIEPVGTAASTLTFEIVLLSLIFVLAALILAYVISRRIVRPIAEINESAKALAAGHYDITFGEGGYREINELSETLTYAAAELAKVEDLQKELIANISHDLRTPLTMIIGYGEVMRDVEGENTPQNVQVIIDEAKRLSELVNDLLMLSRCRAGCEPLASTVFDLGEAVSETLERYRQMLASRGFVFDGQIDSGATVTGDRSKLLQVVYNLLNNAVNHSGDARTVRVNCLVRDGIARVEVIDRGEGIPQEKLTDIWQRYYKVDSAHKRSVVGSGLGLSIVRGILELHGARYGVDSRVGEGSRFWFELRLSDAQDL